MFTKIDWAQILQSVLVFVFTGVTSWVVALWKKQKAYQEQQDTRLEVMVLGTQALIEDRLYSKCTFLLSKQTITAQELESVEKLYTPCEKLGVNKTVATLVEKVRSLNIKEED